MIVKDCKLLDRFLTSYKRIMIQLLENSLFILLLSSFLFVSVKSVYRKTLCLSPPNDQNFSKLRRGGLDNGYKFFKLFYNFLIFKKIDFFSKQKNNKKI